jgi:hypothetical protein
MHAPVPLSRSHPQRSSLEQQRACFDAQPCPSPHPSPSQPHPGPRPASCRWPPPQTGGGSPPLQGCRSPRCPPQSLPQLARWPPGLAPLRAVEAKNRGKAGGAWKDRLSWPGQHGAAHPATATGASWQHRQSQHHRLDTHRLRKATCGTGRERGGQGGSPEGLSGDSGDQRVTSTGSTRYAARTSSG